MLIHRDDALWGHVCSLPQKNLVGMFLKPHQLWLQTLRNTKTYWITAETHFQTMRKVISTSSCQSRINKYKVKYYIPVSFPHVDIHSVPWSCCDSPHERSSSYPSACLSAWKNLKKDIKIIFYSDGNILWGPMTDQPFWFLCLSESKEPDFPQVRPANILTLKSHFNLQIWRPKFVSFPTRNSALTFLSLLMLSSEKALSTVSFSFCGRYISISIALKDRCSSETTSPCLQVSWCEH